MSGYVGVLSGALFGFILTPIMVQRLTLAGFGTWSLILGTMTYVALLEAGLGLATLTRVAASEADGPEAVSRILSTSLAMSFVVAACGVVLTLALAAAFPLVFSVPARLVSDARVGVLLVGGWQCVTFVVNVYSACLLGTGRMYLVVLKGAGISGVVSVAQALLLLRGGGLPEIGAALLGGGVLTLIVYRRQVARAMPALRIKVRDADRTVARHLLSLGCRNAVTSITSILAFGSDIVLVGLLLGPVQAATYAIALRVFILMFSVASTVANSAGPAHAHAARHESKARQFDIYCLAVSASMAVALFAALGVGAFAQPLLELWLGHVPNLAGVVLVLLCAVHALQMPGYNAYQVMLNTERAGELARYTVAAGALNVMASVGFTVAFGTIGPAAGSLLAVVLYDSLYLPGRLCRDLGQSSALLAARVLRPLCLPVGALVLVLALGRIVTHNGPAVLAPLSIGGLAYLAVWSLTAPAQQLKASLLKKRV